MMVLTYSFDENFELYRMTDNKNYVLVNGGTGEVVGSFTPSGKICQGGSMTISMVDACKEIIDLCNGNDRGIFIWG